MESSLASSSQNGVGMDSSYPEDRSVVEPNAPDHERALSEQDEWAKQNVLTFDGGGIRGYFSLLILQKLMEFIRAEESRHHDQETGPLSSFSPCGPQRGASHSDGASPFLPCHYFDYISGTSTGALITIMLTTLRMSVDDCLKEYESLAAPVFGSSRSLHHAGNAVGFLLKRNKFPTTNLENAIKDVMRRRGELSNDHDDAMQFTTPKGLCRAIVLAHRDVLGENNSKLLRGTFIFRSYDNFVIGDSSESDSAATSPLNPGRGTKLAAWKVARAATAAPLYFKPLEIALDDGEVSPLRRSSTLSGPLGRRTTIRPNQEKREIASFTDAGFSRDNNPAKQVRDELKTIFRKRNKKVANWISIGTARMPATQDLSRLKSFLKVATSRVGDPEPVHNDMKEFSRNEGFHYYRLNEVEGVMNVEMDEWEPRFGDSSGSQTIGAMRQAFDNWGNQMVNQNLLRSAAENLVKIRRARVKDASRWERFALGKFFICRADDCIYDTDQTWNYRVEFIQHLKAIHHYDDTRIEQEVRHCSKEWDYKPPGLYA